MVLGLSINLHAFSLLIQGRNMLSDVAMSSVGEIVSPSRRGIGPYGLQAPST